MNRKKFIEELAFLLQDIEDAEREEAMQYYEDYLMMQEQRRAAGNRRIGYSAEGCLNYMSESGTGK